MRTVALALTLVVPALARAECAPSATTAIRALEDAGRHAEALTVLREQCTNGTRLADVLGEPEMPPPQAAEPTPAPPEQSAEPAPRRFKWECLPAGVGGVVLGAFVGPFVVAVALTEDGAELDETTLLVSLGVGVPVGMIAGSLWLYGVCSGDRRLDDFGGGGDARGVPFPGR